MQSLEELNTYSQTQIEFGDDRPFETIFDVTTPVDQTLEVFENQSFALPTGIEILEIIDAENSAVEYIIDMTALPIDIELDFGTLPAGVTVTQSPTNYWVVDGITTAGVWNLIKSPTVSFEFGTTGTASVTTQIEYTLPDSSRGVKETDITVNVTAIDYMDAGDAQEYAPYEAGFSPTDTPTIIADTGSFDPVYTLSIAPSTTAPIESMSVVGNDSAVFTSTTDTLVITGEKDEINSALSTLQIDFTGINEDFDLIYTLTNDLDNNVDIEVQIFESLEFATEVTATASMLGALGSVIVESSIINSAASVDANGGLAKIASLSVAANATVDSDAVITVPVWSGNISDVNYDYNSTEVLGNLPQLQQQTWSPSWTVTATPDILDGVENVTNSAGVGTFNFNPTTKVSTMSGTISQINSLLDALSIEFNDYYADVNMTYTAIDSVYSLEYDNVQFFNSFDESILLKQSAADTYTAGNTDSIVNGPRFASSLDNTSKSLTLTSKDDITNLEINTKSLTASYIQLSSSSTFLTTNLALAKDKNRFIYTYNNASYVYSNTNGTITYQSNFASPVGKEKSHISRTGDWFAVGNKVFENTASYTYAEEFALNETLDRTSVVSGYNPTVDLEITCMSGNGTYIGATATHQTLSGSTYYRFAEYFWIENNKDGTYTILESDYYYTTDTDVSSANNNFYKVPNTSYDGMVYATIKGTANKDNGDDPTWTGTTIIREFDTTDWSDTTSLGDSGSNHGMFSYNGDRYIQNGFYKTDYSGANPARVEEKYLVWDLDVTWTNSETFNLSDIVGNPYHYYLAEQPGDCDDAGETIITRTTVWETSSDWTNSTPTPTTILIPTVSNSLSSADAKTLVTEDYITSEDLYTLRADISGDGLVWASIALDEVTSYRYGFFVGTNPGWDNINKQLVLIGDGNSINSALSTLQITTPVSASGEIIVEYDAEDLIRIHRLGEA